MSSIMSSVSVRNIKGRAIGISKSVGILRNCYASFRCTHSVRKDRKTVDDSGLTDPNLSVWRSINAEHKEVEHVPTDQTESILNYYKERWIQEHKEKKEVETISGNEVSRDDGNTEKKSLYSQLAARKMSAPEKRRMGGNMPLGLQGFAMEDQATITAYDPFKLRKAASYNQGSLEGDGRDRGYGQLRGNDNAPNNWNTERSPFGSNMPLDNPVQQYGQMENQQQHKEARPIDAKGPYRPSFSMADFMNSNKAEASGKNEKNESARSHESPKDGDMKDEPTFQTAPPPSPDFKPS